MSVTAPSRRRRRRHMATSMAMLRHGGLRLRLFLGAEDGGEHCAFRFRFLWVGFRVAGRVEVVLRSWARVYVEEEELDEEEGVNRDPSSRRGVHWA